MRFTTILTLFSVLGLVVAPPMPARGGYDAIAVVTHIFTAADADESGALSPLEYADAALGRFGISFADCDADSDGEIVVDEYIELYKRHHGLLDEIEI